MKTINKIYFLSIAAFLLMFSACQEDVLRDPSPEDAGTGAWAYFTDNNKTSMSFMPDDPTVFTVEIGRRKADQTAVVQFAIEDEEDVFVLENTVSFNTGETVKTFEVDFSEMELGMEAALKLTIDSKDETLYGNSSIIINVLRDYNWLDRGSVEFYEEDFGLGTANVSIEQAEGTSFFRLRDLYNTLTEDDSDPVPTGLHLNFYLDTLNNWAADDLPAGFQDLGTGYELYWNTVNYGAYCVFTNKDNMYNLGYIITPDGAALYLGGCSFLWNNQFPGELPDPYEGDAMVNVDWTMADAEVNYWGVEEYSYEIEDKYGNPDWALIDEYEIILSNPTDEIVLSLLTESTEAIELPTGEFNISASNKENTVRAGIKADSPTGSYVEIKTSVEATLYLVRGTVTITEEGGEYTIVVDAESALGSTVKAKWTGSITIADKS
ncbi:MAG: hypothetical protein RBS23_06600 [Mariniphaga sp.]|jgi:hypothetical protein|nr:hypothetical protein [Mariniphaga sp.]